jgi:hypothetical protein
MVTMRRTLRPLAGLAIVAALGAGCSSGAGQNGDIGSGKASATDREKAVRFAQCMRENGVRQFPDPDPSGDLTIDAAVNGSSLDPSSAAWKGAIGACKGLEPAGFTGHTRSAAQQKAALRFARCMREHGVRDFPDPAPDAPLIDTTRIPSAAGRGARSIPGFDAAAHRCAAAFSGQLGRTSR